MQYKATSPDDYVAQLPEERQIVITQLREIIKENLPEGFADMSFHIQYIQMDITATPSCRFHLSVLLPKRILLPYITWEYMQMKNLRSGL